MKSLKTIATISHHIVTAWYKGLLVLLRNIKLVCEIDIFQVTSYAFDQEIKISYCDFCCDSCCDSIAYSLCINKGKYLYVSLNK